VDDVTNDIGLPHNFDGPLLSRSAASTGHPIRNKKAKAERNGVSSLARIDASIEKMIAPLSFDDKDRDERSGAMWKAMLEKQDVKLGLVREKVEAAKLEAYESSASVASMALATLSMTEETPMSLALDMMEVPTPFI
jgi:hypothetical protein